MPPQTPSAQTSHEISSPLKYEPFTQSTLLPVCCLCGLIRDERGSSPGLECWLTPQMYYKTYDIKPEALALTHAYCPQCFTKVRDTTAQHLRKIGPSP